MPQPEMMAIGDSLYNGVRSLTITRDLAKWSVPAQVANALNIAADLVAVGAGMHLLHAGPTTLWALPQRSGSSPVAQYDARRVVSDAISPASIETHPCQGRCLGSKNSISWYWPRRSQ